jgi:hypothetical protein
VSGERVAFFLKIPLMLRIGGAGDGFHFSMQLVMVWWTAALHIEPFCTAFVGVLWVDISVYAVLIASETFGN